MDGTADVVLTPPVEGEASLTGEEPIRKESLTEEALEVSETENKPVSDSVPLEERVEDREGEFGGDAGLPDGAHNSSASRDFTAGSPVDDLQGANDGDGEKEAGFASEESYDSAVERMAIPSPLVGSFKAQQAALKQLNEWHSGESSLDSSLLDSFNEEEFKSHVMKIAESRDLSADDELVQNVLDSLLPVVRERNVLLKLSRENAARQALHEPLSALDGVAEAELEEEDANDVMADGLDEKHDDGKVDDHGDGYDGDVEGDVQEDYISNRKEPEQNGADSKLISVLLDGGVDDGSDKDSQFMKSYGEEKSSCAVPQSEADLLVEAQASPPEARYMEAESGVSLEDAHSVERNLSFTGERVREDDNGTFLPESKSEALSEVGTNGNPPSCIEERGDDEAIVSSSAKNGVTVKAEPLLQIDPTGYYTAVSPSSADNGATVAGENGMLVPCPSDNRDTLNSCSQDSDIVAQDLPHAHVAASYFEQAEVGRNILCGTDNCVTVNSAHPEGQTVTEGLLLEDGATVSSVIKNINEQQHTTDGLGRMEEDISAAAVEGELEMQGEGENSVKNHSLKIEALPLHALSQFDDNDKLEAPEPRLELEIKEAVDSLSEGESDGVLLSTIEAEEGTGLAQRKHDGVVKAEGLPESTSDLAVSRHSGGSASLGTDTPSLGGAGPSLPARPAGLGRLVPSLEPAPRVTQNSRGNGASVSRSAVPLVDTEQNGEAKDGHEETREKLQMIRVKFLRLANRLGQTAHNVVVAQVLYRLGLAEQLRGGRGTSRTGAFSFERASVIAEEQEAAGEEDLDFTCTIMLLGKTGVGKSATINSLFDEVKSEINAFHPGTKRVQEVIGTVHGIKLRVIDTPGLLPSSVDQRHNERIMSSVNRFIKKSPPDIVLYFDRLDTQSRDYGDLLLLRTITDTFGAAVWFNAIVVLTHASSAPPDGANGVPLSYEMFVAQRSHVVQQNIRQAAGDMRLMNPVSLVENHSACRTNRAGQRVLPNGQVWKPQLLLLCFASKILAEANLLLKLQDSSPSRPFGGRPAVPPLPFLLSSLLQSRTQPKLPDEHIADEDESDVDFEEGLDSEDDEDYDDLPPFRHLTKDELALLDKDQRKVYFEELEYREKLFQKKQWREELIRRREMRKRKGSVPVEEQEEGLDERSSAVPVPMPDMALPPSFDSDNPSHRYRYLESASQWLVRPVLETHGWDHDCGYEGLNLEKLFVFCHKVPVSVSGQITKDKKEANLQMECAASLKHGEGRTTLVGLDLQTIGKELAYTLRSETRFSNFKQNKTTGGLAFTFMGDTVATGMKLEDRLKVGRRLKFVLNGGALMGRGDMAYGGSLEATLRDKDHPFGRALSTLGLSVMNWHGDLAIGGNMQSQFVLGKTTVIARANLNNRGAGQLSIRASSSEQLQMALIGIIPLVRAIIANRFLTSSQSM